MVKYSAYRSPPCAWRPTFQFGGQVPMHPLVTAVLVGAARIDSIQIDPQSQPPNSESAQTERRCCRERRSVVAANRAGNRRSPTIRSSRGAPPGMPGTNAWPSNALCAWAPCRPTNWGRRRGSSRGKTSKRSRWRRRRSTSRSIGFVAKIKPGLIEMIRASKAGIPVPAAMRKYFSLAEVVRFGPVWVGRSG